MKNKNFQKKRILERNFDSYSFRRVSYILTTKNRANFLDGALSSYRRLVKAIDELIIIDGGSTDITDRIINKYADFVNVYVSEPDKNPAHALSKGMLLARGKYIKHLTDDDVIYPESMEKAIKVMEKHPEVDLLVCGGTKQRGRDFFIFYVPEGANYGNDIGDIIKFGACGVGQVIRRKSLALSGLFPLDVAADFTFPIQCIASGLTVKFCRINLFHHQIYDHSTIIAKASEYGRDYDKALSNYLPWKKYLKYKLLKTRSLGLRYIEKLHIKFPATKALSWPAEVLLSKMERRKRKVLLRKIEDSGQSSGRDLKSLISHGKYKWDGGFS